MTTPTTTPSAIRDRIYTVIEALTPGSLAGDKFHRYRNEGGANFEKWAEAHPTAARRRFQVRKHGTVPPADVSNCDVERRIVTFKVRVAYPQTSRDGDAGAMDRDDAIDHDQQAIEYAIGMCGRANFSSSVDATYPDACWLPEQDMEVIAGDGVDFLEMTLAYSYNRRLQGAYATCTPLDQWLYVHEVFTEDGVYEGVYLDPDDPDLLVQANSGGGGGGGTDGTAGGGGGGGGGYGYFVYDVTAYPMSIPISVGARGAAAVGAGDGGDGGACWAVDAETFYIPGGSGGLAGVAGVQGAGGAGAEFGIGEITRRGGDGGGGEVGRLNGGGGGGCATGAAGEDGTAAGAGGATGNPGSGSSMGGYGEGGSGAVGSTPADVGEQRGGGGGGGSTLAAAAASGTASVGIDQIGLWNAVLTAIPIGAAGNAITLSMYTVYPEVDPISLIEVRDNEQCVAGVWSAAPGNVGILCTGNADPDSTLPIGQTVAAVEAAINASSALIQVTTPGSKPLAEFYGGTGLRLSLFSGGADTP